MFLKHYFPNLKKKYSKIKFEGIAFNSKKVKNNYIFFAIAGSKLDGNKFINEAIKNGAKTIVSDLNFQGKKKKYFIY